LGTQSIFSVAGTGIKRWNSLSRWNSLLPEWPELADNSWIAPDFVWQFVCLFQ
jgi:hypothetical protein